MTSAGGTTALRCSDLHTPDTLTQHRRSVSCVSALRLRFAPCWSAPCAAFLHPSAPLEPRAAHNAPQLSCPRAHALITCDPPFAAEACGPVLLQPKRHPPRHLRPALPRQQRGLRQVGYMAYLVPCVLLLRSPGMPVSICSACDPVLKTHNSPTTLCSPAATLRGASGGGKGRRGSVEWC